MWSHVNLSLPVDRAAIKHVASGVQLDSPGAHAFPQQCTLLEQALSRDLRVQMTGAYHVICHSELHQTIADFAHEFKEVGGQPLAGTAGRGDSSAVFVAHHQKQPHFQRFNGVFK